MNYLTFSTKVDAYEQKKRWVQEGFLKANIVKMKNGLYAVIAEPTDAMLQQPDYFSFAEEFGKEIGREVDVPKKIESGDNEQSDISQSVKPTEPQQIQPTTPAPVEKKWYPPNFAGISNNNKEGETNNV